MSKSSSYLYVRSFTLIELAVSLIISSLVIGFTMSAFLITSKIHNNYRLSSAKTIQFEKMRYLLEKDNLESYEIKSIINGFTFLKDSSEIIYQVNDENLIRFQNAKMDTFKLGNLKLEMLFKNERIGNTSRLDELSLMFEEDKKIIIQKEYAAKELMNNK